MINFNVRDGKNASRIEFFQKKKVEKYEKAVPLCAFFDESCVPKFFITTCGYLSQTLLCLMRKELRAN